MVCVSFGVPMRLWITHFGQLLRVGVSLLLAGLAFLPAGPTRAHQTALAADVVLTALSHLGVPYRFGGSDPRRGFDCSGLVRHVFQQAAALDMPLDRAELAPGDLVFFNTRGRAYSHVGIYVGEGRFVHAPARRGQVRVEAMESGYWRARFNGARRLLTADRPDLTDASGQLSAAIAPSPPPPESALAGP
jgi:hypothetical protein